MSERMHQTCVWGGDGNKYMVVGNFICPYQKYELIGLVPIDEDGDAELGPPTVLVLEDELTFYKEYVL